MANNEIAKVYFLDVGQGTSQVIEFADGNLVIIDCGASADALVMLLKTIRFNEIRAVVLSHWHDDHVNGTPALLQNFARKIKFFYLPQDQPASIIRSNSIFVQLKKMAERGLFSLERLEYRNIDKGRIWGPEDSSDGPQLSVQYPNFAESIDAQSQEDVNQGSGILLLEYGGGRILFPGDAGKKAFKALVKREGNGPIHCNILAAPHHSGKLSTGSIDVKNYRNCYHWLYQDVVKPDHVVISVGTDNTYGHPLSEHLFEAIESGATIICTQITHKCHRDVQAIKPSLLPLAHLPAECARNHGVGCGGTVVAELNAAGVIVERLSEHQDRVNSLSTSQSPLCRPKRAALSTA